MKGKVHDEQPDGERLVYTIKEAAELLGISKSVAYEAARDGTLPALRISRRVVIPRKSLLAMLDVRSEPSETGPNRRDRHAKND